MAGRCTSQCIGPSESQATEQCRCLGRYCPDGRDPPVSQDVDTMSLNHHVVLGGPDHMRRNRQARGGSIWSWEPSRVRLGQVTSSQDDGLPLARFMGSSAPAITAYTRLGRAQTSSAGQAAHVSGHSSSDRKGPWCGGPQGYQVTTAVQVDSLMADGTTSISSWLPRTPC
ncbi:hypothetical protein NDU88_003519 [Pleurodeles waltl]|uniref:Uncharacterized protein n=1 Tax=Pleurodeles waltl TaxID=8319 RepID=A0AAV7NLN9_PLEWA|nr:hypothetical protein NDU88_003519 [Pleurodeles waltl]